MLQVTKKVRSYEKIRRYEVTKLWKGMKLRKRYEEVTKGLGYKVTKLRDSNATYRDNLLWRIVMHYGKMPRATGLRDLWSHLVAMVLVLLLRKRHGKNRACAEHTSGQGWPLPVRHVTDITSGEKAPLGWILRNFQWSMHRTYFRTWLQSHEFR